MEDESCLSGWGDIGECRLRGESLKSTGCVGDVKMDEERAEIRWEVTMFQTYGRLTEETIAVSIEFKLLVGIQPPKTTASCSTNEVIGPRTLSQSSKARHVYLS